MADEDKAVDQSKLLKATSMNATFTLDALMHWPARHSILLVGDHGVGKDGIIQTAARIKGVPLVDIRLSQNDVGDLKGMPFLVKGRTMFAPPDWMPFKDDTEMELDEAMDRISSAAKRARAPEGYLFFNEANRATREVQQCAFEIVLDRTMNTRALRDGWRIVSAVNGDDHYQVNVMDLAFKSRFYIIRFRPTVDEWLAWARENRLHPSVISFVQKFPRLLDPTEELLTKAETDVTMQVQNRRAWHMFSDCLLAREDLAAKGKVPQPVAKDRDSLGYLLMMATGYVGSLAAIEYMRYIETDYQSLSGSIILNQWSKDVSDKVKAIIADGRVIEISRYSEMIVSEVEAAKSKELTAGQKRNLTAYTKLLTKEMRAHLWKHFLKTCRDACMDWYGPKDVQDMILESLKTPGKSAAPVTN